MAFLISMLWFLQSESTFANGLTASNCADVRIPIESKHIHCLVTELVETRFPELTSAFESKRILFRQFDSNSYFLKTSFLKGIVSKNPNSRIFSIDINPKIFAPNQKPSGPPSVAAIQGILAHELVHIVDYETASTAQIIKTGFDFIWSPSRYERFTDKRAFERGFAEGIQQYRYWIYEKLTMRQLKIKKKRYYTPDEIDQWMIGCDKTNKKSSDPNITQD